MTVYHWTMIVIGICSVFVIPAVAVYQRISRRVTRHDERIDRLEHDMKARPDKSDIVRLEGAMNTQIEAINGMKAMVQAQGTQMDRISEFLLNRNGGK